MIEKKFESLIELRASQGQNRISIGRCSALLLNRLQCLKGSDFLVTEKIAPTTANPTGERLYQLCRMHAVLEEREMTVLNGQEPPPETASALGASPLPPATKPPAPTNNPAAPKVEGNPKPVSDNISKLGEEGK